MKTLSLPIRFLACALVVISSVHSAAAQTSDADRARIDAIARDAASRFAAANGGVDQTRPTTPAPPLGEQVNLSMDDATARALERNTDIAVERLNPQTFDLQIAQLSAVYRPTAQSNINTVYRVQPPTSTLNGGSVVDQTTNTYNSGIAQSVPWGGGNFTFLFNNNKQITSNNLVNYNPAFNSNFQLAITQPLMRGFMIDNNRQRLRVTALGRDASEYELRGTIATTLAAVRDAYWDLVFTIDALGVAKNSLALAQKLVQDNQARVEVGAMAPLDVVTAQAQAAAAANDVTTATAAHQTAELALKRLIVNGTDDPMWTSAINPTDRPTFDAQQAPDVQAAVKKALENRSDLAQARKTVESNATVAKYLHNTTLPQLDFVANYGAAGLGGTQFTRSGTGVTSIITGTVPGGYGNAWRTLTGLNFPTWTYGVNFSYPLGGQSAAEAGYARAKVQQNQASAQLRAMELQVATDVTNTAQNIVNGLAQYQSATVARQLAQQRLDAEQSRFDVGLSTNFQVVQAQRDLATAQNVELRALLNYRKAMVDFDRAQNAPPGRPGAITAVNANAPGTVLAQ
jgi:outer membrane protein TolC